MQEPSSPFSFPLLCHLCLIENLVALNIKIFGIDQAYWLEHEPLGGFPLKEAVRQDKLSLLPVV